MYTDKNFVFSVNVSRDNYANKGEASACLSLAGAKAVGKVKMAFSETCLTVDQFLQQALSGHSFCNLFDYDPNQKYWIETSGGKRYQSYPVYRQGRNKGCMKLNFKSDRFFRGSQTVFVDIDYTRFKTIPEYLDCLTLKPTCAYMSYSDKLEKDGVTSRRFRLVYVMDRELNKMNMNIVNRYITDCIIRDTGEPMADECGTRASQYFNGVRGNDEYYVTYNIFSRLDFPDSLPDVIVQPPSPPSQQTSLPTVEFDDHLLHDMGTMDYQTFMHYNSLKYCYFYRTERAEWIDGLYQLTDESYLQLWWHRETITDGNHRRRTLFKRACLRRLINPYVDANTLLFNMYLDFNRFIDNTDHIITLDTLTRRTRRAMMMTYDELRGIASMRSITGRNTGQSSSCIPKHLSHRHSLTTSPSESIMLNLTSAMTGQNRFRKMPLRLVYPRPHCIDIAVKGTSRRIQGRGRRMFRSVKPRNRPKLTRRPRSCCIMIRTCQRPRIVRKCYSMA